MKKLTHQVSFFVLKAEVRSLWFNLNTDVDNVECFATDRLVIVVTLWLGIAFATMYFYVESSAN